MLATFRDSEEFYAARGGKFSGEDDFGAWWVGDMQRPRGPKFRVSVVHDTGDVMAVNMWTREVRLLGVLKSAPCTPKGLAHEPGCVYEVAERVLAGWSEGGFKALAWVEDRLVDEGAAV